MTALTTPRLMTRDEVNEKCYYTTFRAEDIIEILHKILDRHVTQSLTKNQIIQSVTQSLLSCSWEKKARSITAKLKSLAEIIAKRENPEILKNEIESELNNIIAFIQISAGFDSDKSKKYGILPNVNLTFHLLPFFMRTLLWPESHSKTLISQIRINFSENALRTLADIINYSSNQFENSDRMKLCLASLIDYDTGAIISNMLKEPFKFYYDSLVVDTFLNRPQIKSLLTALKSAKTLGKDISEAIEMLPNDKRKFQLLRAFSDDNPKYKALVKKTVANCEDTDTILLALHYFPNDSDILNEYAKHLSISFGNWLNSFIERPKEFEYSKQKYRRFKELSKSLNEEDQRAVYESVKETDLIIALKGLYDRGLIDRTSTDPMILDILSIINTIN